jgi:predicted nucleotidyltransferase
LRLARGALSGKDHNVTAPANTTFLDEIRPKLAPFCRRHRLRHLAVFGSFSRGEQQAHSDIDLLATLENPASVPADELFEMAGEAEELLGRPVDFVLRDRLEASSNRLAREHILATAVTVYGD